MFKITFLDSKTILCAAFFLLLFFALLLGIAIYAFKGPYSGASFDKAKWIEAGPQSRDGECARGAMGADLVENKLKPPMLRAEVEELLGAPDDSYPNGEPNEFIYSLGICSKFIRIDFDFLHVVYDDEDRLVRAFIRQH